MWRTTRERSPQKLKWLKTSSVKIGVNWNHAVNKCNIIIILFHHLDCRKEPRHVMKQAFKSKRSNVQVLGKKYAASIDGWVQSLGSKFHLGWFYCFILYMCYDWYDNVWKRRFLIIFWILAATWASFGSVNYKPIWSKVAPCGFSTTVEKDNVNLHLRHTPSAIKQLLH